MSEQWPFKKLGDCLEIQNGYAFASKQFDADSGMQLIRIRDLKNGTTTQVRFQGEYDQRFVVNKGDLLIGMDGEFVCYEWEGGSSLLNQRVCRLQNFSSELLPRFVYYGINKYLKVIEDNTSYTTVKHLSGKKIKDIDFPIPPLKEQQRIVSILDEALENSKSMLDECKKKLLNSVELFRSLLRSFFVQSLSNVSWNSNGVQFPKLEVFQPLNEQLPSSTRGRKETERTIEGNLSLSVGLPSIIPRKGWSWSKLTNLARLESGHTPSRKFPEYWGGDVPWIGLKDARNNYGKIILNTLEQTNQLGLANSAARLLPKGTVCLSRTASVGYVVVMGTEMATSQDFVNWVCTPELDPHFLKFLLIAERDGFTNYSSGSVHQTIYFPEVKAFHICHPDVDTQRRIAEYLNGACLQFEYLQELYKKEIEVMEQLGQSILVDAFNGKLTGGVAV